MKFKAKAKDCQLLVKAKASIGESIDEKELDRFSRVYLRGFLKPKMVKRNLIEYTGPVGISLYERLKKPTNQQKRVSIHSRADCRCCSETSGKWHGTEQFGDGFAARVYKRSDQRDPVYIYSYYEKRITKSQSG